MSKKDLPAAPAGRPCAAVSSYVAPRALDRWDANVRAAAENWVLTFEWEHDKLHAQVHAALEAVAADIWDEGADAGEIVGYGIGRDNWAPRIANPYRATEDQ